MNPSQLEKELEQGCQALGGRLYAPITGDDFRTHAAYDDERRQASVEDRRKLIEDIAKSNTIPEETKSIVSEMQTNGLTEAQIMVYNDLVPEYRRQSSGLNGFFIKYDKMSADEEFVYVHALVPASGNTEVFWMDKGLNGMVNVNMSGSEIGLRLQFGGAWYDANAKRLAEIEKLAGKPWSEVGKAVIQFIKGEEQ